MKIAVLLKMVPDLVEELEVDASGKALDTEELKFKLNEFDDHALEEALLLTSEGDEVVAFALDGDGVEKLLFTALAKGASRRRRPVEAGEALTPEEEGLFEALRRFRLSEAQERGVMLPRHAAPNCPPGQDPDAAAQDREAEEDEQEGGGGVPSR